MALRTLCVVTGANSGIGLAACTQLAANVSVHVVMACRSLERGKAAVESISEDYRERCTLLELDMSLTASVKSFVETLKPMLQSEPLFERVVLINNAAVFDLKQRSPQRTEEGFDSFHVTNYLSPWLLCYALGQAVAAASSKARFRVLNISSLGLTMHPALDVSVEQLDGIQGPNPHRWTPERAYYLSKMLLHMFTKALIDKKEGLAVQAVNVMVTNVRFATERLVQQGYNRCWRLLYSIKARLAIEPAAMAQSYVHFALCSDEEFPQNGSCVDKDMRVVAEPRCVRRALEADSGFATKVWEKTATLLGVDV